MHDLTPESLAELWRLYEVAFAVAAPENDWEEETIWPDGSLRAHFDSECPECGELIREGTGISYAPAHGGFTHSQCPAAPTAVRPGEVACSDCFLIHPEGKCDR